MEKAIGGVFFIQRSPFILSKGPLDGAQTIDFEFVLFGRTHALKSKLSQHRYCNYSESKK